MDFNITILKFHISTLEILCLWPRKNFNGITNAIFLYGCFCLCIIFGVPVLLGVLHQFYVGIYNVDILLESLIAVCDIIGYMFAYTCFLKNKSAIENIIKDINYFLQYCPRNVIEETDLLSTRYTKWVLIYVSIGVTFNLSWPLMSRKNCIVERSSDIYLNNDPCGMPTHNYYPFDASQPLHFWIVYIVEAVYAGHICYVFSTVTATIIGLLMQVSAQLKHCGYKFEHVRYTEEAFASEFKEAVKYHQCLLLYAKRIFKVFRAVLSAYIAMISFAMAVIAYQIVRAENIQDSLRYAMLLLGWSSLFFLVCLHAQKVQDEVVDFRSVAITNSIYNGGWTNDFFGSDVRRDIVITMHRTQKPIHLKIPCLGLISLSQFIMIVKTAYSVFALLLTVTENPQK